jgi:acyl carrier protein
MPDDELGERIRRLEAEVTSLKAKIEQDRQRLLEEEVIAFVAEFTGRKRYKLSLDATLFRDLGVAGLDGVDLMKAFGKKFRVDLSDFDWPRHFGNEGLDVVFFLRVLYRRLFCEKRTLE